MKNFFKKFTTILTIIAISVLVYSWQVPTALATITYVNNAENFTEFPTSPVTVAVDIGTRTNGLLVVGLSFHQTAAYTSLTVTYGEQSMIKATEDVYDLGVDLYSSIWYLKSPPNDSNNLVVTYTIGGGGFMYQLYTIASWYDGVDQTAPLDQINSGHGDTEPSLNITPGENNELIVSHYNSMENSVLTVGSGETLINDYDQGGNVYGGSYAIQTTAGAQTIEWTGQGADESWSMSVASFKQTGGAPPPASTEPSVKIKGGVKARGGVKFR